MPGVVQLKNAYQYLVKTLEIYELEGSHESRNALIARVLRENNLMRELGEGMKRIFSLMQELAKPELYSNGLSFRVILFNKTVFSQKETEWLKILRNITFPKIKIK